MKRSSDTDQDLRFLIVTIVQPLKNGSVDHHKNVVYHLEGDHLPPLATEEADLAIPNQDSDKSDIVLVESSEFLEDDYGVCRPKESQVELNKETNSQELNIVVDEGDLVSDNDLPSPPVSISQELHIENIEDLPAVPPTPSRSPENCISITEHFSDKVVPLELLSNGKPEELLEFCSNHLSEQFLTATLDKESDIYSTVASNLPPTSVPYTGKFEEEDTQNPLNRLVEDRLNSQSVDDLKEEIKVHIDENNITSISKLKEEINPEKLEESLSIVKKPIDLLDLEHKVIELSPERELTTLSTVEKQVNRSSDLDEEVIDSAYTVKELNDPVKSYTSLENKSFSKTSQSLTSTEFCPEDVEIESHSGNDHCQHSPAVTEPLDDTESNVLLVNSSGLSAQTDSSNQLPHISYRNSLASSETVPSKQISPTNSSSDSVNTTNTNIIDNKSNSNNNLKELTLNALMCDTSMSTTVGVSDIMADQSEIRESYISYPPYEIDNTPSQSSFGHIGDLSELSNHVEYRGSLDVGDDYLPNDIKDISEINEDNVMNDRSEYTNVKNDESYCNSTYPAHSEQELHQNVAESVPHRKSEAIRNNNTIEPNIACLNDQNTESQQKLTFNQIKEDLEKKNKTLAINIVQMKHDKVVLQRKT
ncbi:Protein F37C4.5 [Schistosoma japonicum]|nr:Protein F37C4.5 [Schistosoma japonicum]